MLQRSAKVADGRPNYHLAVIGHGVLISELEGRLRGVEQHLGLSPTA